MVDGFTFIRNEPNLDQAAFYSGYLHPICYATEHFGLTFPETVSLEMCIIAYPNSTVVFSSAVALIVRHFDQTTLRRKNWGFYFSFMVQTLMKKLFSIPGSDHKGIMRFNTYGPPCFYQRIGGWIRDCCFLAGYSLACSAAYPKAGNQTNAIKLISFYFY